MMRPCTNFNEATPYSQGNISGEAMKHNKKFMSLFNPMGIAEFVGAHFLWGVITMTCYRSLLRCPGDHSLLAARLILCGILIAVSVVGGLLEGEQRRNGFSVFLNLATGYGIYTAITYAQIRRGLIIGTLMVAAILSLVFVIYLMQRKIIQRRNFKRIICNRVRQAVYLVQMFMGLGFAFIILELQMNYIFGSSVMSTRVSAFLTITEEEETIAANMDVLELLREDRWRELDLLQKLEVLTVVGVVEQNYLGLSNELNVYAANLPEYLAGYYNDARHEIVLNMDDLLDESIPASSCLESFLHEVYHSYEYRCSEAYDDADEEVQALKIFQDAKIYMEELDNYCDGTEDFDAYYTQQCEADARAYAESRVKDYYKAIYESP